MKPARRYPAILAGAVILLALAAVIVVSGCEQEEATAPESATDPIEPGAGLMLLAQPEGVRPLDDDDDVEDDGPTLIETDEGGMLTVGRFTLTIPEDVLEDLDDDVVLTMSLVGGPYLLIDLGPEGLEFDEPVRLEVDLEGLPYQPYTDWTIWWFNEATGQWEDEGGVFDPETETVTAYLWHFSIRGPGRAGW